MRDFTLNIYKELLNTTFDSGYSITSFKDYLSGNNLGNKIIIFRHDVDRKPAYSLNMAKLENELGIKASYYFRVVKESHEANIIKEVVQLGHEIGYHYEDLSLAKGNFKKAIKSFEKNLNKLRQFYPVKTICMHGSPLSQWDNRLIWSKYNYHNYGIIGEPYFDIDFNKVLYLTDTGRRWNGEKYSIRDKVNSKFKFSFKSTFELINELKNDNLPRHIMINIHPQRWHDNIIYWNKEIIFENIKNIIKKFIINS